MSGGVLTDKHAFEINLPTECSRGRRESCSHLGSLQHPQRPQRDPLVGLLLLPKIHPGLTAVVILQRPAPLVVLFFADQRQGVRQPRVASITQTYQGFDDLQDVGYVKDRETELPPVPARPGAIPTGLIGLRRVGAEEEINPLPDGALHQRRAPLLGQQPKGQHDLGPTPGAGFAVI